MTFNRLKNIRDARSYSDVSLRSSEGWGFDTDDLDEQPADGCLKTGSISFQNVLLSLQNDEESLLREDDEMEASVTGNDPYQTEDRTNNQQKESRQGTKKVEFVPVGPKTGRSEPRTLQPLTGKRKVGGKQKNTNRKPLVPRSDGKAVGACDQKQKDDLSESSQDLTRTTAAETHQMPDVLNPKPTHDHTRRRRTNSLNPPVLRPTESGTSKQKQPLLGKGDVSEENVEQETLPKLRVSQGSLNLAPGKLTAPRASSPKPSRKKSFRTMSHESPRRHDVLGQSVSGVSNNETKIKPLLAGPITHASVPNISGDQTHQVFRRYSSVNLPPITGAKHRRHSSVVPALSTTDTNFAPFRQGPSSPLNALAQTFGSWGGGGVITMDRHRRVSQAMDELLHIEELRMASEMRHTVVSGQSRQAGGDSQAKDLGDMLDELKNCRYLRGSVDEKEHI